MPVRRAVVTFTWVFIFLLSAMPSFSQETQAAPSQPVEVYVWGRQPTSAATEQTVRAKDFELRPSSTPTDILRLVPGLFIAQHAGGGKPDQIFLRGFDADHGTDVAIFVDGIPVNMVSHAHGQGYADLHWLIPEIVDRVEVYKGPYFVQFGDIATAGAVNIVTKRRDKDSTFTITGGNFNTQRYLSILSPPEGTPLTPYIAFEAYHNDGPFKNPNDLNRFNLFTKLTLLSTASSNLSFLGTLFKSYWNASGQLPAREVRAGRLGRFDSVDTGEAIPLAPRFFALSGLTARHPSGLEGRIQLRSVGDRYGTEDRTFNVRGYNIFDLLLKYKWDRYEFLFAIDNIANKKWRSAQFVFESQLPGEPAPVRDFHFTPGDPLTIRAGATVHLW